MDASRRDPRRRVDWVHIGTPRSQALVTCRLGQAIVSALVLLGGPVLRAVIVLSPEGLRI